MPKIVHVDCTLRDGGYYNNWDFSREIISSYLEAMAAVSVDIVELGFRSFDLKGYRGPCAYTSDRFIHRLSVPTGLTVAVMVNASELVKHPLGAAKAAALLFSQAADSPVKLVRIACHAHEVAAALTACDWLIEAGYRVGLNLMQVADRSDGEVQEIAAQVVGSGVEVLYFADSLGSLDPAQTARIVNILRRNWTGPLGIHTHDNMGRAISNTLRAIEEGVSWVDSTVTGMGRGPGNAQTEYLVIELERLTGRRVKLAPLLALILRHFGPMKARYGWGQNPFYYLAGQLGIHPTYIQEMLTDSRFKEEDILSVIDHLRKVGGKKYSPAMLEQGRQRAGSASPGTWRPAELLEDREVLILGAGASASVHCEELEQFIKEYRPFVLALNTQTIIDSSLIDARAACHPVRLMADCDAYSRLSQPLIVPFSGLDEMVREKFATRQVYDFGMTIKSDTFTFNETDAVVPSHLVIAYVLAMCASGLARKILLAGFDGYPQGDPRNTEMEELLSLYQSTDKAPPLLSITPTDYLIPSTSIYAF